MLAETDERLSLLRRERERTRTRLIELEIEIASIVTTPVTDLLGEIAEAEERGAWPEAARLRAASISGAVE
jgi:hypothetical protein